jgi:outer membrane protein assembly factor BamB
VNRVLLRASVAVLLLLASILVGWRMLKPAEVLATSSAPYPPAGISAPGVRGRINVAPLFLDGRLRVYAAKHQVRADEPIEGGFVYTSRWSLRRWPEQLSGVVAAGSTVLTRWSDGEVVALDGRTGKILWRRDGPKAPGYAAHRTGAAAVWNPPGLRVAAGSVVVTDGQQLLGYDVSTGAERLRATLPAGCVDGFTTAGGAYACATGVYDLTSGKPAASWPAGPFTPVGCGVGDSNCAGFRDAAGHGWLAGSAVPARATALDQPDATLAAGLVVSAAGTSTENGLVTARQPDGTARWTWTGQARVLGGTSTRVLLFTPEHDLVVVNAATGQEESRFRLAAGKEDDAWEISGFMITEHYLAIERRRADGPDDPDSPIYYYTTDTVLLAAF